MRRKPGASALDVLVVCTGNYCRSPLAEAMLRRALPNELSIASAGTLGFASATPHSEVARLLAGDGFTDHDIGLLRPKVLRDVAVREARLILTAEAEHRHEVVQMVPHMADRTFTLREFARLVEGASPSGITPAERLESLVSVAKERLSADPIMEHDDDIADPMGLSAVHFDRCFEQINDALAWTGLVMVAEKG